MADDIKDLEPTQEAPTENEVVMTTEEENKENNTESKSEEIKDEFVKSNKKNLVKKILIGVISLLLLLIIIGIVLYFLGFFEPEKIKEEIKKEVKQEIVKEKNTIEFDLKDINSKKLNQQLAYLTNKNINQEKIDEKEKLDNEKKILEEEKRKKEEELKAEADKLNQEKSLLEAKKLELEQQKIELESLKQEALALKDKMLNDKEELENKQNEIVEVKEQPEIEKPKPVEENIVKENLFLQLINVAKIKGNLYKSYLDKITLVNPNVLLCRDDKNRIEIYFGPFNDNENRSELLNKLIENDFKEAYEIELTQEEFDKRCNY